MSRLDRLSAPLRVALDKRVEWTISLLDDRLGRRRETLHDRIDDLERFGRASLQAQGWLDAEGRVGEDVADLGETHAAYLNWAAGPEGYAAQAGLWFNPPVPVNLVPGGARVLLVNERVIEQPWVFAAVGAADPPLRIVDVGGSESTVAVSLATLGHHVEVIDPRGYPVQHPNLVAHACRLDEYDGPGGWDVAVCLSAVEHFGLEHYGQDATSSRADHAALARLRELVAPGGRLLLTVPFGPAFTVAGFERIYDEATLAELVDGWTVSATTVAQWHDRLRWEVLPAGEQPTGRAVALVDARP